mgnify:CR=1 FL=1
MKKTIGVVASITVTASVVVGGCSPKEYSEYEKAYEEYAYEQQKDQEIEYKEQLKVLAEIIPSDWDAIEQKVNQGDYTPLEAISKGTRYLLDERDMPPSRFGEHHFRMSDALLEMMEHSDALLVSSDNKKMEALKKAHNEYLVSYSRIKELGPPK